MSETSFSFVAIVDNNQQISQYNMKRSHQFKLLRCPIILLLNDIQIMRISYIKQNIHKQVN